METGNITIKKLSGKRKKAEEGGASILLDLRQFPELHGRILRQAKEQFRTPEMQAMYLLAEQMKAETGGE